MANYQLSEGSLRLIIMNDQKVEDPVVQILGFKKIQASSSDKERYRILLSDGLNSISFAMITMQANSGAIENFSVIKLKKYLTSVINNPATGDKKVLLILEKELVVDGRKIGKSIGDPKPLDDKTISKSSSSVTSSSIAARVNDRPVSPPNPMNQSISENKVISTSSSIKMMDFHLSVGSLLPIMNNVKVKNPLLQVLGTTYIQNHNISSTDKESYLILLSDVVNNFASAMISLPPNSEIVEAYSIIKLKKYATIVITNAVTGNKKALLILEMEVVVNGNLIGKAIGEPTPLGEERLFRIGQNQLSTGSLWIIMDDQKVEDPIMQVLKTKTVPYRSTIHSELYRIVLSDMIHRELYHIVLSDGVNYTSCGFYNPPANSGEIGPYSVIKLKKYHTGVINCNLHSVGVKDRNVILILEAEVIVDGNGTGNKTIGDPKSID